MSSVSKLSPSKKKKEKKKLVQVPYAALHSCSRKTPEARRIEIPTQNNFIINNECIK